MTKLRYRMELKKKKTKGFLKAKAMDTAKDLTLLQEKHLPPWFYSESLG